MGSSASKQIDRTQRIFLLKEAIRFQDLIEKFDESLNKVFNAHFTNVLTLSIFNHRSEQSVLQAKILRRDKKFRKFAVNVSRFKKLVRISVTPKSDINESFESFEVGFNYKENETFVNHEDLNKLVETLEVYGNKFSIKLNTTFNVEKTFDGLKKEVSNLINSLDENNLNELKSKLENLKETKLEIKLYKK